ncbi:hypothetical protein KI387_028104, partial [Taxus chinensis]
SELFVGPSEEEAAVDWPGTQQMRIGAMAQAGGAGGAGLARPPPPIPPRQRVVVW